jgi:peptidylprolyl isomerase
MRSSRNRLAFGLLWLAIGCGPGDAAPRHVSTTPAVRSDDGVLFQPALQRVAADALARDGAALRAAFSSSDPAVRARAAFSMASVRDLGAAPELRALLTDPDPRVRADAAFALAHYSGVGDAGEQMSELLARENDPAVRDAVIDALGRAGYSRSLAILLELDGRDRAPATLALSRAVIRGSPPASAIDTLVARLTDPDPGIRRNAAYFLERIENPGDWIDFRGPVRSALDAMPVDDPAAMSVVTGLGGRFDVFSLPRVLYRARNASDWRVRANAIAALSGMGDGGDRLGALLDGLDDPSPHVRAQAAVTLASSPPDPDVQAWLVTWAEDHMDDVESIGPILMLLAQAGNATPLFEWVEGLALDDDARWAAALPALAEAAGEEVLTALLRATSSPSMRVAGPAATALVERIQASETPTSIPTGIDLLGEGLVRSNPAVIGRMAVALAGARLGPSGGVSRLTQVWEAMSVRGDASRRAAISSALVESGSADALESVGLVPAAPPSDSVAGDGAVETGPEISLPDPSAVFEQRAVPTVDWAALAELGARPRLVFETDEGRIVLELAADQAPLTVQRLTSLAAAGRFDGIPFHRVVANFVIQGGDLSRAPEPGLPAGPMRTEITRIPFERGVVGMANTGSLDTESSQFFITHDRKPHLDGGYTSFGWVVEGMDVVDRIQTRHRIRRAWVRAGGGEG